MTLPRTSARSFGQTAPRKGTPTGCESGRCTKLPINHRAALPTLLLCDFLAELHLRTHTTWGGGLLCIHPVGRYKEENADVVRLYDLTALCGATEGAEDVAGAATSTPSNPFAYPVAVLLFRIAARMYRAEEGASAAERDTATIESLLKNVLQLITATQYPELAAATTFLLVGLHTQTSSAAANAYRGGAKSKQTPPPRTKSKQKQSRSAKKGGVPEPSARDSTPDGRLRRLGDGISWAHTGAQPTKSHAALLGAILDLAYTNYLLLAEHLMGKRDGPRAIACAHMALMCHAGATATHDRSSPPTGSPPREPAADPSAGPNGAILPFAPVAAIEGFVGPASAGDTARARVLEVVGDVYVTFSLLSPSSDLPPRSPHVFLVGRSLGHSID